MGEGQYETKRTLPSGLSEREKRRREKGKKLA
jgi:hypothetical protein